MNIKTSYNQSVDHKTSLISLRVVKLILSTMIFVITKNWIGAFFVFLAKKVKTNFSFIVGRTYNKSN